MKAAAAEAEGIFAQLADALWLLKTLRILALPHDPAREHSEQQRGLKHKRSLLGALQQKQVAQNSALASKKETETKTEKEKDKEIERLTAELQKEKTQKSVGLTDELRTLTKGYLDEAWQTKTKKSRGGGGDSQGKGSYADAAKKGSSGGKKGGSGKKGSSKGKKGHGGQK